ncbi:MAG: GMC family oxidoreductase [Myxococcales bacterium]|nr:GMC family oxidoreductase [Myxococcales bacterium]MBP6845179.1 GMC family oxidoreductase [Kofleriaceae bacterium]
MLSPAQRATYVAVAEAALPAGRFLPAAGAHTIGRVEAVLAKVPALAERGLGTLLGALDAAALLSHRRRFARLELADRLALLERWSQGGLARRTAVRALVVPLKVAHFDDPALYRQLGCVYEIRGQQEARAPYPRERVHDLAAADGDLALEVDAVVIGTGAGGAVMARELAEAGVAVVMIEEGRYFERHEFTGRPFAMQQKMYRDGGATLSVGNVAIPIPLGVTVGGTTTVNSGTCYRVPEHVLAHWRDDFGLREFTADHLDPYYQRVERVIGVAPTRPEILGGCARVIARGCDALGYRHAPLKRNAPDCDGQGVCCFGCPTDAKRSTNVSYVPLALRAGAELFTHARADRIIVEGGRAVGVTARAANGRTLTVRARAVIVACGSIMTPGFLERNHLGGGSGQLGRNLSIHPAAGAIAEFDEAIDSWRGVPQSLAIEEFHEDGILFEGAATPLEFTAALLPHLGPRMVDLCERFDRIATFGLMVSDTSRGRVRQVRGRPLITYVLNQADLARMHRGLDILARVFFAAGARTVMMPVHGFMELRGEADLARFRAATISASDLELSAYHPLGTARLGPDPASSVVDPDHQVHGTPGLYVVDGASVPSSLGVNPQLTIMALATRAAERLAARLG